MYSPTTRLLTALEVLQSNGRVTGPNLAEKLEVDVRSVRRYITMLRDLGIPVESEAGRYGAYYLRPGFRLPPLMFNNAEMPAIIIGLLTVRQMGLSGTLGVESAIAKIERILPSELQEQVHALQRVLSLDIKPHDLKASEGLITTFSTAAYQHTQVELIYQAARSGTTTRHVDVYGLVYHLGNWYAVGYCHLRHDLRVFRLDRVKGVSLCETSFDPPTDFDPLEHVWKTIATIPSKWQIEVLLLTTLEDAQFRVPMNVGVLEPVDGGILMRCNAAELGWMARYLVELGCPLRVIHPTELRVELRQLAASILAMADESES
jgi:predicted DNA-binding transcriptional regulator YafY